MKNADKLMPLYRQLWNSRSLPYDTDNEEDIPMLHNAMRTELKDELTHPRARKKPVEKYAFAVKRILDSSLSHTEQILLIKEFTNILDELKKES